MDHPATLILAQPSSPAGGPGPEPQPPEGLLGNPLVLLVMGFAFIYFFLIRPQKREQDEKQRLLDSLKKNDKVVTTSGIFGTIVNLKDNEVTLRIDDQAKVKIRMLKSAIARVESGSAKSADELKSKKS